MSLTTYTRKRNFSDTPEPAGRGKKASSQLTFVVQRHDASHLHYDFRLELDGVLKSWAIPKGPSLNPRDKRLAVMVEDHPLEYGKFEGVIPAGNYGAGTVDIWDKGTYTPETPSGDPAADIRKALKAGTLKFILNGSKLKGSFALVRINDGKKKNWLLIKHHDTFAVDDYDVDSSAAKPTTKRTGHSSAGAKNEKSNGRAPRKKDTGTDSENEKTLTINRHQVKLTNQQKIFWPDEGYTKGDVITYYNTISSYILPYLKDRPQSLKRNPNGIMEKGFYHKDAGDAAPDWVSRVSILAESTHKTVDYIICNNRETLLYLNNLGCIEINPWNSRASKPEHPDYLVLDIDPDEKNTFDEVIDVALIIHEILEKAGATSYCKTSGATGMHIYVPLHAVYPYDQVRPFAELVARLANEQLPKTTTLERPLHKRKGRIYIDYLQNSRGQTLASVYSLRPVPHATVSTPLEWKEVRHGLTPLDFDINSISRRLEKKGDLFRGVLREKTDLKKCIAKLEQGIG